MRVKIIRIHVMDRFRVSNRINFMALVCDNVRKFFTVGIGVRGRVRGMVMVMVRIGVLDLVRVRVRVQGVVRVRRRIGVRNLVRNCCNRDCVGISLWWFQQYDLNECQH